MSQLLILLESVFGKSSVEGKNYLFTCPFHGGINDLHIEIQTSDEGENKWNCFSCEKGGYTIKQLFKKANVSPDKKAVLDTIIVPKYFQKIPKDKLPSQLILPTELKSLSNLKETDYCGKLANAYLKGRGFTDLDIIKYNLGYCEEGKFRNRIIFPSYDAKGKLNYFTGRTFITGTEPRYLACDSPRTDIVPFELYINWKVPVVLCEGFFDAKAIARNALPLLEKRITPGIMSKLLSEDVKQIYIALDKDALKDALDHADILLSHGKKVYIVELDGKDPSEMGTKAFYDLFIQAKPVTRDELLLRKMKMMLYE